MRRLLFTLMLSLMVAGALAGCGKEGAPKPPEDEPPTYPRVYPTR
jgi:predicted small lipoprotein YifL